MRASQEYKIAIAFCEPSKRKINRYSKSSKSTSDETSHVRPPLDNAPASLNTDVNEPRPNKTLIARNGVVMANLEEARVVGKAVSNTGLFCMDDPGVTLQEAQNSGLFCLDDTAHHVATFFEEYTSGWDSRFLVDGTDKGGRKRPLDIISS